MITMRKNKIIKVVSGWDLNLEGPTLNAIGANAVTAELLLLYNIRM